MKMQSRNRNICILLVLFGLGSFINLYYTAFAADSVSATFTNQSASASGSNNSVISVGPYLQYVNKGENSSIIGNYLRGYYYDNILGFFKTDWSSNQNQNVRIVSSTSKCPSGYGYKLGGLAYSSTVGFIDFDYNQNIYVYYCVADSALHGYAYGSTVGFQNFEGITFAIENITASGAIITGTGFFTNDTSSIRNPNIDDLIQNPPNGDAVNSNFSSNTIQANTVEFESLRESLFYIIK